MKCFRCLQIKQANPGRSKWELSPDGSFEAVTTINGTAYCTTHALLASKPLTKRELDYYNPIKPAKQDDFCSGKGKE